MESGLFVISQLSDLQITKDKIVIWDIIPYGRSTRNNGTIQCYEDSDENCLTYKLHVSDCHQINVHIVIITQNKIQACIINNYLENYTLATIQILVCYFNEYPNSSNGSSVTEDCLNQYSYHQLEIILACAQNNGNALLNSYADRVSELDPKLSYVPWILVNGVHNEDAQNNLLETICDQYLVLRNC